MPRLDPRLDSPGFKANPYPIYARLRTESPVYRAKVAFWLPRIWIVTRYDDVVSVLKDSRFSKDFTQAYPWVPRAIRPMFRNLLTLDPPDHTRLRSLVQKAFTPRLIEGLRQRIQTVCDDLLDRVARSDTIDLIESYALPVPLTIIADLLGVPVQDRRRFGPWTKKVAAASGSAALDAFVVALPAVANLSRYIRRLVALRRKAPQDDLITALVRAEESGETLTEDEIVSMVNLLLVAGHETTVHLIATGALTLIQHQEQRIRMQETPALAATGVEEILRYASPVEFSTPRVAREDVAIGGVTIPCGELIAVSLGSANHDPSQFPDPETFDVGREPNKHVAFGAGSHFCLGASLARLEGEVALSSLFRRFPNLSLAVQPDSLRWRKSLALRGLVELPVNAATEKSRFWNRRS